MVDSIDEPLTTFNKSIVRDFLSIGPTPCREKDNRNKDWPQRNFCNNLRTYDAKIMNPCSYVKNKIPRKIPLQHRTRLWPPDHSRECEKFDTVFCVSHVIPENECIQWGKPRSYSEFLGSVNHLPLFFFLKNLILLGFKIFDPLFWTVNLLFLSFWNRIARRNTISESMPNMVMLGKRMKN